MDTISVGYGYPWQQQPYQQHIPLWSLLHGCYSHPLPSGYVGTGWQDQFIHFSKVANNPAYSPHPFTVKLLTSRTTRCQGCGSKFPEGKTPLQPAHDLSASRSEAQPFFSKEQEENGHTQVTEQCTLPFTCLMSVCSWSDLLPCQLVILDNVLKQMQVEHKQYLWQQPCRTTHIEHLGMQLYCYCY